MFLTLGNIPLAWRLGPAISQQSLTTVKFGVEMMASLSDVIIFIFLGIVTAKHNKLEQHSLGFILWTVILCFAVRFAVTYGLSAYLNKIRVKQITKKEQFIMAYGGLR